MSAKNATSALRAHLATMTGLPPVAYENVNFTPTLGTLHIVERTLFAGVTGLGMSTSAQRNDLIYSLLVYAPKGQSIGTAQTMADKLADRFKRGTILTNSGTRVECHTAEVKGGFVSDAWYVVPVDVKALFFT